MCAIANTDTFTYLSNKSQNSDENLDGSILTEEDSTKWT